MNLIFSRSKQESLLVPLDLLPRRLLMRVTKPAIWSISIFLLLLSSNYLSVHAQSLDINSPSPVGTTEVIGRIVARDVGDARFTDHYYSFAGNKGDLLITVVSSNLNGDVDVFTAGTLRPLMKFTVYAESSSPITKAVFLRKREDLILRVQARSPNDEEGTYQVRFGGTFEALPETFGNKTQTPTDESITLSSRSQSGRRVSSVGARIEEPTPPPAEVAAAPTPEPTPQPTPETPVETSQPTATKPTAEAEAPRTESPRSPRSRRGSSRRSNARARTEPAKPSSSTEEKPAEPAESATTTTPRRRGSRRNQPAEIPTPPESPEPDAGPRLVIETANGTLVDRSMNTVRRVMVENGQVVVVSKDGRVQRIALSQVTRMSIAP
jgi:hypothetical protein